MSSSDESSADNDDEVEEQSRGDDSDIEGDKDAVGGPPEGCDAMDTEPTGAHTDAAGNQPDGHGLNDGFFNLDEFEKFADLDMDEEQVDLEELDEDEDDDVAEVSIGRAPARHHLEEAKHDDFFGPTAPKSSDGPLSSFEQQQATMGENIAKLEELIVNPRSWEQASFLLPSSLRLLTITGRLEK